MIHCCSHCGLAGESLMTFLVMCVTPAARERFIAARSNPQSYVSPVCAWQT